MIPKAYAAALVLVFACPAAWGASFEVSFSEDARREPVDGRLLVIVSAQDAGEPRFHVGWGLDSAQVFGVGVDGWLPGQAVRVDETTPGHPRRSLAELEPGRYRVQAVLNVYETFRRADGHVVKLPADDGEGQRWSASPGNLYSQPLDIELGATAPIRLELTETIPAIDPPEDTKYVRHLRIRSEKLTAFWGKPIHLGAIVLVPEGFDDDPDARYPVLFNQGHFPSGLQFFREQPPSAELRGGSRRWAHAAHEFYQHWTAGRLPKMLIVLTRHATPFYDDSYGVNSANAGPWGDALIEELYPRLEQQFHAIGEPWARVLYGGSTGGWISLAQQVLYPDFFGGAWGFCPDPVDFHRFQLTDVYTDTSAYYDEGPFKRMIRPLGRTSSGHIFATTEDFSLREEVLGPRGRSGGQLDAFHATFGPVAADGYPAELWDPLTGVIDPQVARHWRENFDLTAILQREWKTLGPRLIGKLHVTMGTQDTFYLEGAAYLLEEFLESTKRPGNGPYYAGSFTWGDNEPHCYTGVPDVEGLGLLRYYMPIWAEHMRQNAPQGADTESWFDGSSSRGGSS